MKTKISIPKFIVYLSVIGFVPNIIGAMFIFLYFRFLDLTSITRELGSNAVKYDFTIDIVLTVSIYMISIIAVIYYLLQDVKLLMKYKESTISEEEEVKLKRGLLNTPSLVIRMTFFGWFLAATVITISMHLRGMSHLNKFYFFIIFVIAGSLTLVTTYYLFDNALRKYVPQIFPDADFSMVSGVRNMNINLRMLIAFWIGGILPVIMLIIFSSSYIELIRAGNYSEGVSLNYFFLVLFALGLSIFMSLVLSFYFSGNIGEPLAKLEKGMKEIAKGNFEVSMIVNQKDEIGNVNSGFNMMARGLRERERIKDVFGKFVSSHIRDEVLAGDLKLGGEKTDATILFCDIRNFTTLSEKMNAEDLVAFLNSYFNRMVKPVIENDGVLDKFIGDAIMAVFGPPIGYGDNAEKACNTALDMKESLAEYNSQRKGFGKEEISIGIGINTGEIVAGNIGNIDRMEYTVIGDTVNIASRVEGLSKVYGVQILITENTIEKLPPGHGFIIRELDIVMVKGRRKPVLIYELIDRNV